MEKIINKGRQFFTPQKTEERVRFTLALTKLIVLLMLALGAKLVTSNSRMLSIRWRGINPSAYCITDSSHLLFSSPFLTLMQTPFIRTTLQILSSLMIDAAFFYFVATWYISKPNRRFTEPGSSSTRRLYSVLFFYGTRAFI